MRSAVEFVHPRVELAAGIRIAPCDRPSTASCGSRTSSSRARASLRRASRSTSAARRRLAAAGVGRRVAPYVVIRRARRRTAGRPDRASSAPRARARRSASISSSRPISGSPMPSTSLSASAACHVPTMPASTPSTPPSAQFGTSSAGGGFGIETAIARAAGARESTLTCPSKRKIEPYTSGLPSRYARVVDQIARREVIGAVEHDVVEPHDFARVGRVKRTGNASTATCGLSARSRSAAAAAFVAPDVGRREYRLALQIRLVDRVVVDDADASDAGRGQIRKRRRAESARADDEHARRAQALLTGQADFGNQQMAAVAPPARARSSDSREAGRSLNHSNTAARACSPAYVWSLSTVASDFGSGARSYSSRRSRGLDHPVAIRRDEERRPAGQTAASSRVIARVPRPPPAAAKRRPTTYDERKSADAARARNASSDVGRPYPVAIAIAPRMRGSSAAVKMAVIPPMLCPSVYASPSPRSRANADDGAHRVDAIVDAAQLAAARAELMSGKIEAVDTVTVACEERAQKVEIVLARE